MIIFGTRGVTYTHESGDFHCPSCTGRQSFRHRRVRRFFTLYFIPIIPLDLLGEYIECGSCDGTYELGVLSYNPEAQQAEFDAQFEVAIRRVMVLMMLADGVIDDEELVTIANVYEKLTDSSLTEEQIRAEAALAQQQASGVAPYLKGMVGVLNDSGKELVIKAAFMVAAADGEFQAEEQALLAEIADALGVSGAHLRGIIDSLTSDDEDDDAGVSAA